MEADVGTSYRFEIALRLNIVGRNGILETFKPQLIVSDALEPADSARFVKSNTTLITGTLQTQVLIHYTP